MKRLPPKIILWGGTGQAKIISSVIEYYGSCIVAVFDDTPNLISPFPEVPIYLGWKGFQRWISSQTDVSDVGFCITIGNPHGIIRLNLHNELLKNGLFPTTLIHPNACIANTARIGEGTQILAGAVIQANAKIGTQCIINSNVYIDHDTIIGNGSELVAGSQLMGLSRVGDNSLIGASSIILSRINIGSNVIIGSGVILSKDVPDNYIIINNDNRPQ